MIGVIPNPKKTVVIEKDIKSTKEALTTLHLLDKKIRLFKSNEVMNQFTFEATEFMSLGVFIDVNLIAKGEDNTEITVEIRRKVGTFNKSHEVTYANEHLQKVFDLISSAVQLDKEELEQLQADSIKDKPVLSEKQQKNVETNKKILKVFGLILLVVAVGTIVAMIIMK